MQDISRIIVVLGAPITKEGKPGPDMKQRLDRCLEILAAETPHPRSLVVVTGGAPRTYGSSGVCCEGDTMHKYLAENGVASNRILVDNQAMHTFHNALYSKSLLLSQGYLETEEKMELLVLTTDWHMTRSMWCFRAVFCDHVFCDQPNIKLVPMAVKSDSSSPDVVARVAFEKTIAREWVGRCIQMEKTHPAMPDPLVAEKALFYEE